CYIQAREGSAGRVKYGNHRPAKCRQIKFVKPFVKRRKSNRYGYCRNDSRCNRRVCQCSGGTAQANRYSWNSGNRRCGGTDRGRKKPKSSSRSRLDLTCSKPKRTTDSRR